MPRPLAALFVAMLSLPAFAADKLPTDLALVPGNATLLVHIKAADVWKSDLLADTRAMFEKAGEKVIEQFDTSFTPRLSTIDRVTVAMVPGGKDGPPVPVLILGYSKPVDVAAIKKANLSKAREMKANGRNYYVEPGVGLALHFADDSTLVVSDARSLPVFLETMGKSDGPMKPVVEQAANAPFLLAVSNPGEMAKSLGLRLNANDPLTTVLKSERVTLAVTFGKDTTATFTSTYATADGAKAGEDGLKALAKIGRELLTQMKDRAGLGADGPRSGGRYLSDLPQAITDLGQLGWINAMEELLSAPPIERADKIVTVKLTPSTAVRNSLSSLLASASAIGPAYSFLDQLSARRNGGHNLSRIGLSMHHYYNKHEGFPAAAICDKKGTPLLSWRVALLPYLGEEELYKQFKLDEPWDSEHNKKLIEKMPVVFADPRVEAKAGETYYKVFVGENAGFAIEKGRSISAISDGTYNTLMVVSAGPPVPWTKPTDIEVDPRDKDVKLPNLTRPFDELVGVFFDGHVQVINTRRKDAEAYLRALISPGGGEITSDD